MSAFIFRKSPGFTLIELILVIVLIGILAAIGGMFIARPIEGYTALSRRAELVDSADTALRRMQRDIRLALPNSIRISGTSLELLHSIDGGRYRAQVGPAPNPGNPLTFTAAATRFDVLGSLNSVPVAGDWVVVYNLSATGGSGNAYLGDDRATITGGTVDQVDIASFKFPRSSPYQRFFIVDTPVSYVCDPSAGTLTRYSGYTPQGTANTPVAAMGAGALMTNHVSGCSFIYDPGTPERAGLVTMRLTLTASGETITLLHQVHVENAP